MLDTEIVASGPIQGKYYVYVHQYPDGYIDDDGTDLSNVVFYVGKGTVGNKSSYERIDQHEVEARRGDTAQRHDVIRKIWQKRFQIQKRVVYETDVEQDALIYEWGGINMIWSSPYLANLTGNSYAHGRMKEKRQKALDAYAEWALESGKRSYTLSEQSQEILLQLAQEENITPLECLEQLIQSQSRGSADRRAS